MAEISVIVPIYKVEKHLRKCLDSIMCQTFSDFEVLCIDDCSPDQSVLIVKEFMEKYPEKVKIFCQRVNLGLGAARDLGLSYAQGKYVVFFDSDDYVKEDYLEVYYGAMEKSKGDIVVGGYYLVQGEQVHSVKLQNTEYAPWLYPSVWIRMYRRSFLQEHGLDFRALRLYEDNPFQYRCMLEGAKVTVIDYCGYYYVCNPTSLSRKGNGRKKFQQFLHHFVGVYEEYHNQPSFEKHKDILEYVYLSALGSSLMLHSHHAGAEDAFEMYMEYQKQMKKMFPNFKKNNSVGFWKRKEEQKKVRYAMSVFFILEKLRLGKMLIWIISL